MQKLTTKTNSYFSDQDQDYSEGCGVLKNLPQIQNQNELEEFEDKVTTLRLFEMIEYSADKKIDFALWKQIHKILFRDVYEWAGEVRSVQMSKGKTTFAHPQFIEREGKKIFEKLAAENFLQNLSHNSFCDRLAYYHTELNALHPFREGNGRTLKLLLNELAQRNDFYIAWESAVVGVENYLAATIKAHEGNQDLLLEFFEKIVVKK